MPTSRRLVFDIGMHLGEDTAFYLSRGCRVVGVEANPALVASLNKRFEREVASYDVVILPFAIGFEPGKARFATTGKSTIWGTLDRAFIDRAVATGIAVDYVDVEVVPILDVIEQFGVPYYMKVDIEGMDEACFTPLARCQLKPRYVSLETSATSPNASIFRTWRELKMLHDLGYRRFKLVDQSRLGELNGTLLDAEGPPLRYEHELHASGPFGEETGGTWRRYETTIALGVLLTTYHQFFGFGGRLARTRLLSVLRRKAGNTIRTVSPEFRRKNHWYDIHAAL
jgi:FkbM family methyltransferase